MNESIPYRFYAERLDDSSFIHERNVRIIAITAHISQESENDNDDDDLFFYNSAMPVSGDDDNPAAACRLSALTASIMALAPSSFPKAFESLLRASLENRDRSCDDDQDTRVIEEYVVALSFATSVDTDDNNRSEVVMLDSWDEAEGRLFANIRMTGWIRSTRGLLHQQLCHAIH
jgi:hypothetical protein